MRKFQEGNFTWVDFDLMVSEASYLELPVGKVPTEFEVEGFGVFTYQATKADTFVYTNELGLIAQIFND